MLQLAACGGDGASAQLTFSPSAPPPPVGLTHKVYDKFTFVSPIGGIAPFIWSVTGTLPEGMSLNSGGQLSGTPLIAGTFTPFVLIKIHNAWGLGLLAVVWAIAAIGIAIKLFFPRYLEGLTVGLYLIQGWAIVAAWRPLVTAVPTWVAPT